MIGVEKKGQLTSHSYVCQTIVSLCQTIVSLCVSLLCPCVSAYRVHVCPCMSDYHVHVCQTIVSMCVSLSYPCVSDYRVHVCQTIVSMCVRVSLTAFNLNFMTSGRDLIAVAHALSPILSSHLQQLNFLEQVTHTYAHTHTHTHTHFIWKYNKQIIEE